MEKNKIVLIQVWIGKIPDYFWYHYETTKHVSNVDFLFFTDQDIKLDSPRYKVINTNLETLENNLSQILGQEIKIKANKKTCDLKASFGRLFYDYIKDYEFFGCYDIDTLFGDINNYVEQYLDDYDFISVGDEVYHNRLSGPFLLMRNIEEIRNLFICERYVREFDDADVNCFEELALTDMAREKFRVKIIYSTNVDSNHGGKNLYDAYWTGGKVFVNDEEKMIHHFYKKNKTKFQKVGNTITSKYDKVLMDDFMWVAHFSKSYETLIPFLIESIKKYSNRKCVFYTINYTSSMMFKTQLESEQFIFRRIEIPEGLKDSRGRDSRIMNSKPEILMDAIKTFPDKKFVHIDTDISLTTNSDDISKYIKELENYPLANSHVHDVIFIKNVVPGEEWTSSLHILLKEENIENQPILPRRKCNIILFDKRSYWFFEEQMKLYHKYKDSGIPGVLAIFDEDTHNTLLAKYGFTKSLPLLDIEESHNLSMDKINEYSYSIITNWISPFVNLPKTLNDYLFFHGFKHPNDYIKIREDYGNSVLDCEEIVVSYYNNTLFFEKNTLLGSKTFENNVDFVVTNMNNDEVIRLSEQKIFYYALFYISNFYIEPSLYKIKIYEKSSGKCLFNDLFLIN
jgi:hypothetical protein